MNPQDQGYLDRDEQFSGDMDAAHRSQIEGRLKELHTMLPGIIQSFDANKQTATVLPAIKRIFTEQGPVNLPLCVDVPVAFPGGGDFFLTFPVQPGDECILMFSERAIDNWYDKGGTQLPSEYRLHDLSDGVAIVGLNSQPRKLAGVQATGAELRTRDRSCFIRLEAGNIYIQGNLVITGTVTQTGDTVQTGKITASVDVVANGTSLHNHKHSGVTTGSGQTGTPV